MKSFLVIVAAIFITSQAKASYLGDEFHAIGIEINQLPYISDYQAEELKKIIKNAKELIYNSQKQEGLFCMQGTLYGPNNLKVWSGNSDTCENSDRFKIYNSHYACMNGTVYGPDDFKQWTGDTNSCSDETKIKIGWRFICINGTIYGPNNFKQWTGNSEACATIKLD